MSSTTLNQWIAARCTPDSTAITASVSLDPNGFVIMTVSNTSTGESSRWQIDGNNVFPLDAANQ